MHMQSPGVKRPGAILCRVVKGSTDNYSITRWRILVTCKACLKQIEKGRLDFEFVSQLERNR